MGSPSTILKIRVQQGQKDIQGLLSDEADGRPCAAKESVLHAQKQTLGG